LHPDAGSALTRIALATYAKLPSLNDDDRLLVSALGELGIAAVPAVWDSPTIHWEGFQAVLVRSCWDYHRRLPEFLTWIDRVEAAGVTLWNPPALLRWNSHKAYLRDLAARGVPIVPTRWLARRDRTELAALLDREGWQNAVIKPAVSASATETWRTSPGTAAADQRRLDELLDAEDVLVQPFVPEVETAGEWSVVFLGGQFSHAVLKRPADGDYRVQWEFGGSALAAPPPDHLVADAGRVLAAAPGDTVYARVDGVVRDGRLLLMELELIEPHLFLGWDPGAAGQLAAALGTDTRGR
jgi:glutathione synthase/RimK-type ligase-like ATP-grasp enzyme